MKTREKILYASLALFNEEGEPNVTTVDIAAEIDISPGNLYYHFKGKGVIIIALYEQFEAELVDILNAPLVQLSVEDRWIYLYVVFERIYAFRFFYRNQTDILHRVPELLPRFKRLLNRKFRNVVALLTQLREAGVLQIGDDELGIVSENMVLLLTQWLTHVQCRADDLSESIILHRGVFQLFSLIVPYLASEHLGLYDDVKRIYHDNVS
ncbi:MAG: TetR/AcrR family transcriptional regulator [Gammaproteobacteria bacterium]|nr:TetR/AcrR family transcriptional regulator [Gammaproteobacteria bacterium]MBT8152297.1 TetR/AcrR family transcriptional regulator [Gammaproteobacteria bacterium]NND38050.1 TetR/AcrR family transcriptional regulator [Pseudomonadales bacterium]NNM10647.1 TetR/AcrR family transcriptional regulator [Pseudomonadales bacterium]RZV59476.1 MAG: TetR/AcrR family transcriptional regulator [Pseudomonadales bacterium]